MNSSIITSLFRAPLFHQHHAAGRLPTLPFTLILTPVKYCCRNFASRRSALSADERATAIQRLNNTTSSGSAPPLVRFLAKVASQFEVRITKKFLAQATPVLGAAGGAAVNAAFSHFFNQCARYHFGLRRLERTYGADAVKALYV